MLTIFGKARSRNTYLSQNFIRSLKFANLKEAQISISINPYDLGKPIPSAKFIVASLKNCATQGASINLSLTIPDLIYKSINEFLNDRSVLRSKNRGNNSTLIQYNNVNNLVTIFGRLDGANGCDTMNICRTIRRLASINNTDVDFFNVTPNNMSYHSVLTEISSMNINVRNVNDNLQEIITTMQGREMSDEQYDELLQRDQNAFKANIIKKYIAIPNFNIHKCFGCDYCVESNLIGAHIYRYADIKRDYALNKLTAEQAAHLIISGENGFLLCPNQDKEFEKGQILFDINIKSFVANSKKLANNEYKQLSKTIKSNDFSNIIFTKEFVSNINEHIKRVNTFK
ncbi:MAG: HNH endonuclease [Methanobrevibacter sp.]|jgi:hypothetical protein|nr:HNH endonuclease [Candidatus Methanovirga basalitermitum]